MKAVLEEGYVPPEGVLVVVLEAGLVVALEERRSRVSANSHDRYLRRSRSFALDRSHDRPAEGVLVGEGLGRSPVPRVEHVGEERDIRADEDVGVGTGGRLDVLRD